MKIFTLCTSLLLIISFFSGCVQNSGTSNTAPITVTIHSAYKTTEINGVNAQPGFVFVIVNMTLDNRGGNDYAFNEKSVTITEGLPVDEKLYTQLTGHGYWGAILPNEKKTGDVIFRVKNSTQDLSLRFFYNKGQDSFTQGLSAVPMRSDSATPEIPLRTTDNAPATFSAGDIASQGPVSLTINSIQKASKIKGSKTTGNGTMAGQGHVFVILDVTIKNNEIPEGFVFTQKSTSLKNLDDNYYVGISLNELPEVREELDNAIIPPVTIGQNEAITGKIIFGTTNGNSYGMNLVDSNKAELAKKLITFAGNVGKVSVPENAESEKSAQRAVSALLTSDNFTYIIENLDTPAKAAQYAEEKFSFFDRKTCVGQTANEFFTAGKGDCLSYANFFSYVLAQHGYDVKKVSFKYHDSTGTSLGHVVTLFTDDDGQLKYATTPDMTVFRNVNSVEELIAKEQIRLDIKQLDIKNGNPNFVTIPVKDTSSCH